MAGKLLPIYEPAYAIRPEPIPADYAPNSSTREIRLREIDFYVTMQCNLHCEFCSVRAGEYKHKDLPLARCIELIEEAATLGLEELHFLGGEPTLRNDIEDMISVASGLGVSTRIITNGMLLSEQRLSSLRNAGLGELMFSVDGLAENHNRLRKAGRKGWSTTMDALDRAIAHGFRTRVAMTAYRSNSEDVLPLFSISVDKGADCFSVFLGSPLGRGNEMRDDVIAPHAWRTIQSDMQNSASNLESEIDVVMEQGFAWEDGPRIDRSTLKGRGTGCNTLLEDYDYLIIRSDGLLYQCVFFMTDGTPIGDVSTNGIERSLKFALERAHYEPFTVAQDKCRSCFHQTECGTGCRGYAKMLKNDWLLTDPRCSKSQPSSMESPEYYPLCPILKWNVRTGGFGGSSEDAINA